MQRTGLILITALLFALGLYVAYTQGYIYGSGDFIDSVFLPANERSGIIVSGILAALANLFLLDFYFFANLFGGSMLFAVMFLALLVELITLYPAVSLQLKQKKIHLFHKKLVDRFKNGELSISESKRELGILYSVNAKIHRRGALLFVFQALAFVIVLSGLYVVSLANHLNLMAVGTFNYSLLSKPFEVYLPLLAALAYLLHALIKIHIKQKEDYISATQIKVALIFSVMISVLVFFFSGNFATLLTVYFITQITFGTIRYLTVENHAKAWGKLAQKELIRMLQSAKLPKSKIGYLSQKFNHLPLVRHLNLHLLEEGISMSLLFMLMVTSTNLIS